MARAAPAVDQDEIVALRQIAIDGGIDGDVKLSCAGLADRLEVSNQTASRRLQSLEDVGLIAREHVPDGQWIEVTERGRRALQAEYEAYRRIFEAEPTVGLRGRVTEGMGEGGHYISLEGYRVQFVERLGYEPFPGTLNVSLDEESVRRRGRLASLDAIPIDGWEDEQRTYGPAVCYPATLANEAGDRYAAAHAIVPERTHHDEDNLEVIAPDKLRDELGLGEAAPIAIEVGGQGP